MRHAHTCETLIVGALCLSFAGCGGSATAQKPQPTAGETVSLGAAAPEVEVEPDRSPDPSHDAEEKAASRRPPEVTADLEEEPALERQLAQEPKEIVKEPNPARPSLGEFRSRNHTVTIHSGERELLFTITSPEGKVLAAELSADQLKRGHPELFKIYESAVGRAWAGNHHERPARFGAGGSR